MSTKVSSSAVPDTATVIKGLNDLLQLDHDAIGSYEIAIEKLENRSHALEIDGFRLDHERHIRDLNQVILALGGEPMNEPHATAPLKMAIHKIAASGGDERLLKAWRTNELLIAEKYDSYVGEAADWPAPARKVVDDNALDEQRHRRWVGEALGDPESDMDRPVVEAKGRASALIDGVKTRVDAASNTLKHGVADRLSGAARQIDELAQAGVAAGGVRAKASGSMTRVSTSLDRLARGIEEGGGGEGDLMDRIADEIRVNPGRSLLATFAVAFICGRVLR